MRNSSNFGFLVIVLFWRRRVFVSKKSRIKWLLESDSNNNAFMLLPWLEGTYSESLKFSFGWLAHRLLCYPTSTVMLFEKLLKSSGCSFSEDLFRYFLLLLKVWLVPWILLLWNKQKWLFLAPLFTGFLVLIGSLVFPSSPAILLRRVFGGLPLISFMGTICASLMLPPISLNSKVNQPKDFDGLS